MVSAAPLRREKLYSGRSLLRQGREWRFTVRTFPAFFLKKSRRYLRCPTTMRWNLCDFCRDRASASRRMCRSLALMIHWQAGKAFPL